MATGDIIQEPTVNAGSNQRFDLVDFLSLAQSIPGLIDAFTRAMASSPISTAGSATGELWQGNITANPVAADGIVRVDTELFVGLNADGELILVPDGTALTAAVPDDSSDYQVYLYNAPTEENSQTRRFLPVTAPFNEFTQAQNVRKRNIATLYLRVGDEASAVAEDAIGSATRPLLFLGVANNTGGTVTFTPASNRLETVTAPGLLPTSDTGRVAGTTYSTGDTKTLREALNVALYSVARNRWIGSNNFTPSAANNFGAYEEPPAGIDVAVRENLSFVTIGADASSSYGTFDRGDYVSDDLLLAAAIAALPTSGGVIYIKPDVTLNNFAADVTIPASTRVKFMSDVRRSLARTTFDMTDYKFVCASGGSNGVLEFENCTWFTTSATTDGNIIELHDDFEFFMRGCYIANSTANTATPVAAITANAATTDLKSIRIEDTTVSYTNASNNDASARYVLDLGTVPADSVYIRDCSFVCTGDFADMHAGVMVDIESAGRNIVIADTQFASVGETNAGLGRLIAVNLVSTVFTENDTVNRVIKGCTFRGRTTVAVGAAILGISTSNVYGLQVLDCTFEHCKQGISLGVNGLYTGTRMDCEVKNSRFRDSSVDDISIGLSATATFAGLQVSGCTIESSNVEITSANGNIEDVNFTDNTVVDSAFEMWGGTTLRNAIVQGNVFRSSVNTLEAPRVGRNNSAAVLESVAFENNVVSGYHHTAVTTDFVFGVQVVAQTLNDVSVCGNHFHDLQDAITWTGGSDTEDDQLILSVRGTFGTVVKIDDNRFDAIATNITDSGAGTFEMPMLVHVSSRDRTAGGGVDTLTINGNVSEDVACCPVYTELIAPDTVSVKNNSFSYDYSALQAFNSEFLFTTEVASGAIGAMHFCGNTVNRTAGSGAGDVIRFTGGSTGVADLVLNNNYFELNAAPGGTFGIDSATSPTRFCLIGNMSSDSIGVDFGGGAPTTFAPVDPGAGNPFTNNVNITRQW